MFNGCKTLRFKDNKPAHKIHSTVMSTTHTEHNQEVAKLTGL